MKFTFLLILSFFIISCKENCETNLYSVRNQIIIERKEMFIFTSEPLKDSISVNCHIYNVPINFYGDEIIVIGRIPLKMGIYYLYSMKGDPTQCEMTFVEGGDVFLYSYNPKYGDTTNYIEINSIDLECNKLIGKFHCTFYSGDPRAPEPIEYLVHFNSFITM